MSLVEAARDVNLAVENRSADFLTGSVRQWCDGAAECFDRGTLGCPNTEVSLLMVFGLVLYPIVRRRRKQT